MPARSDISTSPVPSGTPDAEGARRAWELLLERGLTPAALETAGPDAIEVARIACAKAPYLATLAARDPGRLLAAARDPHLRQEKPAATIAAELEAATTGVEDVAALIPVLRAFRAREFIRLGARECGLGRRDEVGRELAHLADACLDVAVRVARAELVRAHGEPVEETDAGPRPARFVVMGMGKLGGEELNFGSDVDVIYLYSSDQGRAGALTLHEFFDRLARRVTRALSEVTEDDLVFRVDLRLRPEGSRGPLVNSLAAAERYYESWGRPWERQAWLKARPSAGDLDLGAEALALLEPFVYPRATSPSVVRDVAELNRRIKAELDAAHEPGPGFDVKLGHGGIREVEFFCQALQLVHAGKRPGLRERSTRRLLDRLLFSGLVTDRERRELGDGYEFLRHTEHLLQLDAGRQTHRLPGTFAALSTLAWRLGCADAGELQALLLRHTGAIAAIFATLGGDARELRPEIAVLLSPASDEAAIRGALAALGFRDPEGAAFQLELLRRKPASPLGSAAGGALAVAPALLEELVATPDPDQALRFVVDFASKLRASEGLWRLLDENRPVLRLLTSLFGTSAFLAKIFVSRPELVDTLLLGGGAGRRRGRAELARLADERLAEVPPGDEEAAWNALRRVKHEEILRIGLADVAGELDDDEVAEELTDLADVLLERTFAQVTSVLAARGAPLPPLVVLALGKLGGRELGYASDLDLVFVYDGGLDEHEVATRIAQRLVRALGAHLEEGRLWEVDTRLRPSGRKGTLVSSLAAWRQYHRESAEPWERQALLQARPVAGDPALAAALERQIEADLYERRTPAAELAAAIRAMRARIERELAAGEEGGAIDVKTGRGGRIDVEFVAQFLQLAHGAARPELRVRGTIAALERAFACGLLGERQRRTLVGGYRFLRRIENRMRIVHDRPIHELPRDPAELETLARRSGFPSASALAHAHRALSREVRACYDELLGS